jgi:hypothetical protein
MGWVGDERVLESLGDRSNGAYFVCGWFVLTRMGALGDKNRPRERVHAVFVPAAVFYWLRLSRWKPYDVRHE